MSYIKRVPSVVRWEKDGGQPPGRGGLGDVRVGVAVSVAIVLGIVATLFLAGTAGLDEGQAGSAGIGEPVCAQCYP